MLIVSILIMTIYVVKMLVGCEHIDYDHLWCENVDCEHIDYEHQ